MYAMGIASGAIAMANQAAASQTADTAPPTVDFATVLAALNDTTDSQAATTVQDLTGLSWRDIQNAMLTDSMKALTDKPLVMDPVLAQLMQLMQGLNADGAEGDGMQARLMQLIEQMQKRLQEILEESGSTVAGQQLMALFSGMMPQAADALTGDEMAQALGAGTGDAMLQMALTAQPEELAQTFTRMAQMTASQPAPPVTETKTQTAMAPQAAQTAFPQADAQMTVETPAAKPAADFETAVRSAKQQLSDYIDPAVRNAGKAEEPQPKLDIDALQAQVDAGTYLQNTALAGTVAVPQSEGEAPIPTLDLQLADALKTAVAQGQDQFTLRLAPENLGEVTIQLTRTAEGLNLNIIAKNPETQALLAAQIDALKDNMRPLDVQVGSILSQEQFDLLSQQQQQFSQRQRQDFTALHGAAYYGDEPLGAVTEAPQPQPVLASALDTVV